MRHAPALDIDLIGEFQFTHPGKGATCKAKEYTAVINGFNSRTLGRVRLLSLTSVIQMFSFNSRTLGRVRQDVAEWLGNYYHVSIHAPWEGCDCSIRIPTINQNSFNSRTLGRVRQVKSRSNEIVTQFQFTHPGKGATIVFLWVNQTTGSFNSRTLGRVRQYIVFR